MWRKLFTVIAVFQLLETVYSDNILVFAPIASHSTRLSKWPLMEALAEKGHNVTYLSPLKNFELDPKKKHIVNTYEPKLWSEQFASVSWDDMNWYEMRKGGAGVSSNPFLFWIDIYGMGINACDLLWDDPEFVQWVKGNKFDLVITETYMNECGLGLVHYWKAKLAVFCTSTNPTFYPDTYGLPDETSSIGDMLFKYSEGHQMSFYQRFVNAFGPVIMHYIRQYYFFPALEATTRKALGDAGKDLPPFREIEKNTTVIYITQHYSMDVARAFPPNVIPVGGNVVSKKIKPLPEDMAKFMNESENGFIYISFGTVCDFTKFDEGVQAEFIRALGSFKNLRFVWKSHNPITATELPDNVFVAKWVPQQTVLGHPKVKAYITHSGMGSTTEAIHFSVPVIAIPVLGDQDDNAHMMIRKGAGVLVEIVDMKQKHLEDAINEIIHNKKYRDGMTKLTSIFKDRPMPTLETAVWWTEYVLRHDNVQEFLVHPSIHQPWWKRRQVDVWVTVATLSLLAVAIPLYILLIISRKIFGGGKQKLKTH